jgi:glycosyltransferase involved in cell wall biosynthesis
MTIYYIANARIPTEKAHGIHIMKMCEAFIKRGAKVELFVPKRKNPITLDPFSYYGISKKFPIHYLFMHDAVGSPVAYWVSQASFSFSVFLSGKLIKEKDTVIVSRDILSAFLFSLRGFPVFFDIHGFPEQFLWFWKLALSKTKGVVLTNNNKLERAEKVLGISKEKLLVAPNGYDPKLFEFSESKRKLREKLTLPNGPIAMYTGHLYSWKGAGVLAEVAKFLPNVSIVFIGGTKEKIEAFQKKFTEKNLYFLGHKPYTEIPKYLKSADCLVLPNSGKSFGRRTSHSIYDTSPIKLFEYMASGVPIVASNLPAIYEITGDDRAFLVPPDDAKALADGIQKIIDSQDFGNKFSVRAKEFVTQFSWEKRGENIFNFIKMKL